jgi:hypothetical protein
MEVRSYPKLSTNMREHILVEAVFLSKLLLIGDWKVPHFEKKILIYHDLKSEKVTKIEDLISIVYQNVVQVENEEYQWM